jgi:hypothetical protein
MTCSVDIADAGLGTAFDSRTYPHFDNWRGFYAIFELSPFVSTLLSMGRLRKVLVVKTYPLDLLLRRWKMAACSYDVRGETKMGSSIGTGAS